MGRIFTTDFHFGEKKYSALVSYTADRNDLDINVKVSDPSLHHLLPDGNFTYNSRSGLDVRAVQEKEQAQELVGSIVRSIERQLDL